MTIKEYVKEAIRLTSLIFTCLVFINLFFQREALDDGLEYMLLIAGVSGCLNFLTFDDGRYSNRRVMLNQLLYLLLIFLQITLANYLLSWELGFWGLLSNFVIVLVIYAFIKFFMYSGDKKEAEKINQFIQNRKRDKS